MNATLLEFSVGMRQRCGSRTQIHHHLNLRIPGYVQESKDVKMQSVKVYYDYISINSTIN